jgi:hypothetical protein
MFVLYGVFMLCYFSCFVQRATCLVERSEKIMIFKKESDTHVFYLLFYYFISVFSSMHDRWNIQLFYKMLDPSSV